MKKTPFSLNYAYTLSSRNFFYSILWTKVNKKRDEAKESDEIPKEEQKKELAS